MRILGVGAHPDDLDFGASGSFARWVREGHECYYLICTDGRKGSDDPKMTEEKLVKIRKAEQMAAGKVLGLKGIYFLGHHDTELVADLRLKKEIVRYIRKIKPDRVVTMDPTVVYNARGFVNHTDHRAAGLAAVDAVYPLARDRLTFRELEKEGLEPHKTKELYLISFDKGEEIVDISKTLDTKIEVLKCHSSQVGPESFGWVRQMAEITGKKKGYRYAEGFIKLSFW